MSGDFACWYCGATNGHTRDCVYANPAAFAAFIAPSIPNDISVFIIREPEPVEPLNSSDFVRKKLSHKLTPLERARQGREARRAMIAESRRK